MPNWRHFTNEDDMSIQANLRQNNAAYVSAATAAGEASARILDAQLGNAGTLAERIGLIVSLHPDGVVFSTSLGMEDQAVLHAIAASSAAVDVFTLDTGRHFPETLETIAASVERYGRDIRIVSPERRALDELISRDGVLGFRQSLAGRKACCDVRKVQPLDRELAGAEVWITGLRRAQSGGRGDLPFASFDAQRGLIKVNPLADWSLADLESYIEANRIPINPLHARGFPSIGCQTCTRAIKPGEDIRAGRWWWESADSKECGLHSPGADAGKRMPGGEA